MVLALVDSHDNRQHPDRPVLDPEFIEDNWRIGRIGDHSFDSRAGLLENMFDFRGHPGIRPVLLDPITGASPRTTDRPPAQHERGPATEVAGV